MVAGDRHVAPRSCQLSRNQETIWFWEKNGSTLFSIIIMHYWVASLVLLRPKGKGKYNSDWQMQDTNWSVSPLWRTLDPLYDNSLEQEPSVRNKEEGPLKQIVKIASTSFVILSLLWLANKNMIWCSIKFGDFHGIVFDTVRSMSHKCQEASYWKKIQEKER